jgi:hypothetical protein
LAGHAWCGLTDTVTDWDLPAGTFVDLAIVHLLTTATIEHLRELYPQGRFEVRRVRSTQSGQCGVYASVIAGGTIRRGDLVTLA